MNAHFYRRNMKQITEIEGGKTERAQHKRRFPSLSIKEMLLRQPADMRQSRNSSRYRLDDVLSGDLQRRSFRVSQHFSYRHTADQTADGGEMEAGLSVNSWRAQIQVKSQQKIIHLLSNPFDTLAKSFDKKLFSLIYNPSEMKRCEQTGQKLSNLNCLPHQSMTDDQTAAVCSERKKLPVRLQGNTNWIIAGLSE